MHIKLAVACFLYLLFLSPVHAQSDRYELGKRVRRFEQAWQTADTERRAASAVPMQQAVKHFFTLQYANAARQLDEAYFVVRDKTPASELERFALAQRLIVQPVTLSTEDATVHVKLQSYYQIGKNNSPSSETAPLLESAKAKFLIEAQDGRTVDHFQLTWKEATNGSDHLIENAAEGDYWLKAAIELDGKQFSLPPCEISLIHGLKERLEKLEDWLKQPSTADREDESETVRQSVKQYVQILRSQIERRALETDYPSARLLQFAEQLIANPNVASDHWHKQAQSSIWMTLSHHNKNLPVRVQMPEPNQPTEAKSLPVLFAFHGAGGSENMFFETYGAGRLIELASQQGWLVVAPRHPLLGMPLSYRELLEVLAHFYPIDMEQVYLVGHSMGAAEVVRQVSLDTKPPQAAVILGGGGSAKDTDTFRTTPWFVAAGALDFGRSGAKSLADRLNKLNCRAEYREYAAVEHMVIVQAALDDAFIFLVNSPK